MRNPRTTLVFCVALMTLVGSFAWAKLTTYESKDLKWEWTATGDQNNGGKSTAAIIEGQESKMPAWTFKGNLIVGWQYCAAYATVTPDAATLEKLKTSTGISFKVLGDGDRYKIKMRSSDVTDGGDFEYFFDTVKGFAITVVVPNEFFLKPSWSNAGPNKLNMNNAVDVQFETGRPGTAGPFEIKIWDVKLYSGETPVLSAKDKAANEKAVKDAAAAEAKIAKPVGGNLGKQTIKLVDNFQYGKNWQQHFQDPALFNGNRISKDDTYTLKITFTADRDVEQSIFVGLVDPSPSAGNWRPLTWPTSRDLCDTGVGGQEIKAPKKGEVVSVTLTFKALTGSTGVRPNQNSLVFATRDSAGAKNGPITLTFTEFVFSKN